MLFLPPVRISSDRGAVLGTPRHWQDEDGPWGTVTLHMVRQQAAQSLTSSFT